MRIFVSLICSLALVSNLTVIWLSLRCLKIDTLGPGIATIANLAAVDVLASFWFLLAVSLPDSAGWTDLTVYFEALATARQRNFSESYIKEQGCVQKSAAACK